MHNAMGYVRGGQAWMDAWEIQEGCPNWNATTLKPYFDSVEDILQVIYPANDTQGLVDAIFEASHTAGFPYNPSYNRGPDMYGIANFVMSINEKQWKKHTNNRTYQRVTSYEKYFQTTSLPNLQLIADLQAIGFNFHNKNSIPTLENVELYDSYHRCKLKVNVNKELILSAGTVNSPKLLQLSGIGNATYLQSLGIEVVKDLPGVGMNLRDDVVVNMIYTTDTINLESPPASFLSAVLFAIDNSTDSSSTTTKNETGTMTNIEILFSTGNMIGNGWPSEWQNSLVLSPNIQQCKSRGTVRIESLDPLRLPFIDPAYLSIESDFDRVVNAIQLGRQLLKQSSFAKWKFQEVSPGVNYQSRTDLIQWIRQNATTGFHYIGTCKMGTDTMSVVNPENMKVWGIERLRVIDASIAPSSFSANTQSMTYAIAARAVDIITKDYLSNHLDKSTK